MAGKLTTTPHKFSIGGIKFSQELVHINVSPGKLSDFSFSDLLHCIAEKKINIPFISHATTPEYDKVAFCLTNEDFDLLQSILNSSFNSPRIRITKRVGTLTIFPHKNNFLLLGNIISLFGKYNFPLYSLSTSISAIALNTDFMQLDNVVEKLDALIMLPENHAPFRQEFCLKQMN